MADDSTENATAKEKLLFTLVHHPAINPRGSVDTKYIQEHVLPELETKSLTELRGLLREYDEIFKRSDAAQTVFLKGKRMVVGGGAATGPLCAPSTAAARTIRSAIRRRLRQSYSRLDYAEPDNTEGLFRYNTWQTLQEALFFSVRYGASTGRAYGMQQPDYQNQPQLVHLMSRLAFQHGITRYITLDHNHTEDIVWRDLEAAQSAGCRRPWEFHNRRIIDFTSFTPHNAYWLVCHLLKPDTRTVVHCTAGFGRTGSVMLARAVAEELLAAVRSYEQAMSTSYLRDEISTSKRRVRSLLTWDPREKAPHAWYRLLNSVYPGSSDAGESPADEVFHGMPQLLAYRVNTIKLVAAVYACQYLSSEMTRFLLEQTMTADIYMHRDSRGVDQDMIVTLQQSVAVYLRYLATPVTRDLCFHVDPREADDPKDELNRAIEALRPVVEAIVPSASKRKEAANKKKAASSEPERE